MSLGVSACVTEFSASRLDTSSGKVTPPPTGRYEGARDPAQKHTYIKKRRLAQVAKSQSWQTHLGVVNPLPQGDWARAKTQVGPRSRNPSYPGVDLRITQLHGEGAVGTTWPRMHP
jgi:hypothetical protein